MNYYGINDYRNYLEHHGILGQKWGVRRYQNADGSLTDAGLKRYGKKLGNANSSVRYWAKKRQDALTYGEESLAKALKSYEEKSGDKDAKQRMDEIAKIVKNERGFANQLAGQKDWDLYNAEVYYDKIYRKITDKFGYKSIEDIDKNSKSYKKAMKDSEMWFDEQIKSRENYLKIKAENDAIILKALEDIAKSHMSDEDKRKLSF